KNVKTGKILAYIGLALSLIMLILMLFLSDEQLLDFQQQLEQYK
ncbi:MAG: ABC-type Na+ efflux pump permease subunit, partial [Saprospiraceae bacterium]